jgi:hypothetical protein
MGEFVRFLQAFLQAFGAILAIVVVLVLFFAVSRTAAVVAVAVWILAILLLLWWPVVRDPTLLLGQDEQTRVIGAGIALSAAGAALMVIAVFLPRVESAFPVQDNTFIQSGEKNAAKILADEGWNLGYGFIGYALIIAMALPAVAWSLRAAFLVFSFGLFGLLTTITLGDSDSLQLTSVEGSRFGIPETETASPGTGIWTAGAGGLLALLGGALLTQRHLRRVLRPAAPEPTHRATTRAAGSRTAPPVKPIPMARSDPKTRHPALYGVMEFFSVFLAAGGLIAAIFAFFDPDTFGLSGVTAIVLGIGAVCMTILGFYWWIKFDKLGRKALEERGRHPA